MNRFYVPSPNLGEIIAPALAIANLDQHASQLAEMKRVNEINYGTPGTPGLKQQELGIHQGALDVNKGQLEMQQATQRNVAAQIPDHKKVINPSDILTSKLAIKTAYGDGGVKVFEPILKTANEVAVANPTTTKWDAYTTLKSAWPGHKDEAVANAEKYIESPAFQSLKPAQQETFKQLYNQMQYDNTGELVYDNGIFKNTVASKEQEEANSKAALRAAILQARIEMTKPDRVAFDSLIEQGVEPIEAYKQIEAVKKEGKFPPINIGLGGREELEGIRSTNVQIKDIRKKINDVKSDPTWGMTNQQEQQASIIADLEGQITQLRGSRSSGKTKTSSYRSAEEVRAEYQSGKISKDQARQIIQQNKWKIQ
jgi:hypothetical protein